MGARQPDQADIKRLIEIMATLRTPVTGCPWDLAQNFRSIAPYTLEEAYEVADAIERGDMDDLCDELGDLLLQVVYHAQMAQEEGHFIFSDVVAGICDKMVRRHPHVFAELSAGSPMMVEGIWERIKANERAERASNNGLVGGDENILDAVPSNLPALKMANKLQKKAAKVGFDWDDPNLVFDKIAEEISEVKDAAANRSGDDLHGEVGDLLFAVVNLARHYEIDADAALRTANTKFRHRFAAVEAACRKAGATPEKTDLATMEKYWQAAKKSAADT